MSENSQGNEVESEEIHFEDDVADASIEYDDPADNLKVIMNDDDNSVFVRSSVREVDGRGGDDIIEGTGQHVFRGGSGSDTFMIYWAPNTVTISDFQPRSRGGDHDDIGVINGPIDVGKVLLATAQDIGQDVLITTGGGTKITLKAVQRADLSPDDFFSHARRLHDEHRAVASDDLSACLVGCSADETAAGLSGAPFGG
jgi:hypothetical protein